MFSREHDLFTHPLPSVDSRLLWCHFQLIWFVPYNAFYWNNPWQSETVESHWHCNAHSDYFVNAYNHFNVKHVAIGLKKNNKMDKTIHDLHTTAEKKQKHYFHLPCLSDLQWGVRRPDSFRRQMKHSTPSSRTLISCKRNPECAARLKSASLTFTSSSLRYTFDLIT